MSDRRRFEIPKYGVRIPTSKSRASPASWCIPKGTLRSSRMTSSRDRKGAIGERERERRESRRSAPGDPREGDRGEARSRRSRRRRSCRFAGKVRGPRGTEGGLFPEAHERKGSLRRSKRHQKKRRPPGKGGAVGSIAGASSPPSLDALSLRRSAMLVPVYGHLAQPPPGLPHGGGGSGLSGPPHFTSAWTRPTLTSRRLSTLTWSAAASISA